ncbi:MAG: hypothetical protein L0Y71_04245 [Gemmataceae bacterium]|nr:hypothetical protein [Gemmataceae bacterium]
MIRAGMLAMSLIVLGTHTAAAQDAPWRFQWKKGQTFHYRTNHVTSVKEVVDGNAVETGSKLNLVKKWTVADVDQSGAATLHLSLAALRTEQTRPNGEKLLFDSADPGKSTPGLKQMSEHLGKTLVILRIDGYGRSLEVTQGSAAKYEAEPPFVIVLPAAAPKEGQAWLRPYHIVLEPPQGTGEKYKAEQVYRCAKIAGGLATVAVTTELKTLPDNMQERLPLLQREAQGQAVFDVNNGRLQRVQLTIDKTVQNHQGQGSSYHFVSTFVEELTNP